MKKILAFALLLSGASAAYGDIYTWKDARGTVFYTNSLHEIPARYLRKARVLDVATGKKGGLATAQPLPQGPAATAGPAPATATTALATPAPPLPATANGTAPTAAGSAAPAAPPVAVATIPQPQPQPRMARGRQRGHSKRAASSSDEQ